MKKYLLSTLCLMSLLLVLFSCEEVDEVTVYDNWQERNQAFVDSVAALTGDRYIGTPEALRAVRMNELFALQVWGSSTAESIQYVYCKKIKETEDTDARAPYYTDTVEAFYYGTLITGEMFDGNFDGYGALDTGVLNDTVKAPGAFDSPSTFEVSGVITGWTTVLQYMRPGDRWMVYVPWQSAYGVTASGGIPGYSVLVYDMELVDIVQ